MAKKEQILILFCYSSIVGNFNYNPEVSRNGVSGPNLCILDEASRLAQLIDLSQ